MITIMITPAACVMKRVRALCSAMQYAPSSVECGAPVVFNARPGRQRHTAGGIDVQFDNALKKRSYNTLSSSDDNSTALAKFCKATFR